MNQIGTPLGWGDDCGLPVTTLSDMMVGGRRWRH
jgi:hypothetical protein